jgi:hypothetical protein
VPKKKLKKAKETKSIEVKVDVHFTKTSFMSILLVALIGLMGYSGYLGVNSLWKFTHPQFNVSLDSFKSLGYIAKGLSIPPISGPNFLTGPAPEETAKTNYLQAISNYKTEFRTKYPNSPLLAIPDNDLLNIGWSMCTAKKDAITKNGKFSKEEIISAYQSKFVLKYPGISGLGEFLGGIAQRAFDNLCGEN